MFEGRFAELVVIFVLALVILGPEKLPKVVAEFGRWVGRARSMARQFREQLEEEVRLEEVRKAQKPAPVTPAAAESAPVSGEAPPPAVDVAEALNPHTMASPIDVTGLPPELAQAALAQQAQQDLYTPEAAAYTPAHQEQEPPPALSTHEGGHEPAAPPAAPERSAAPTPSPTPTPVPPVPPVPMEGTPTVQPAAAPQPVSEAENR